MADLLRSGYSMLNLACPVCNNPLFKDKDKEIFCPICKKKIVIVKDTLNQKLNNKKKAGEPIVESKVIAEDRFNNLHEILKEKLEHISRKMRDETQIEIIKNYLEILNLILEILKKIN